MSGPHDTACTRPGCTGTLGDGYCDLCGMAPAEGGAAAEGWAAAVSPVAAATGRRSTPEANGTPCAEPGCTGAILDGYCDVCGTPGAAPCAAAADESAPLQGSGPGTSSTATSASRIQSAALGSRRAGAGSAATRRARTGSQRMRSARLGAGLTVVPPAPAVDAARGVIVDPSVPEDKRSCSTCGGKVGRGKEGRPGRSEGFCAQCGQPFSFTPKLQGGDLVAGQYEVAGAIAHGGLGWIYLARDKNVSDRWVVLKGLLNSGDPDALAAAIAEQQFLAQVEHPLIVEIYNFVTHEGAGYIVMEWVGGRSLKQVLKQRMKDQGAYDPLPVDQALAFVLEVLPAFAYLHDLGLVYCDFKPDNLIQVGDAVKLIDLGGVRRIDDDDSAIFGTVGYQAPEVAEVGTTVASDIYTIGRTLVVLCMEFRGYQGTYLHTLPPPESTPLFAEHDSLYWLIAKCCAPDPADRFASVDELRTQLLGVLREVVAGRTRGTALTSASSVLFESPATISARGVTWDRLPGLRPAPHDRQHAWLSSISVDDPTQRLEDLQAAPEDSADVLLARALTRLRLGHTGKARELTEALLAADPWDWRALWVDGLTTLQKQDWEAAKASFSAVYQQVPGELAPKLALAVACEYGGLPDVAEGLYATCAATDAAYAAPAAFGMARIRAGRSDTTGAVAALDQVPSTSRGYPESRQLRADVLLAAGPGDLGVLDQALSSIRSVPMDPTEQQRYAVRILRHALDVVLASGPAQRSVGGVASDEPSLRDALEAGYRALAREAPELTTRIELVNEANAVRNRTLV
ncbi:MAG: serine/threonine-protein kinase PknG [Nocardioides sp.]|nr:serine/threonine-protein kinase PknG [Nocardioides sp.]